MQEAGTHSHKCRSVCTNGRHVLPPLAQTQLHTPAHSLALARPWPGGVGDPCIRVSFGRGPLSLITYFNVDPDIVCLELLRVVMLLCYWNRPKIWGPFSFIWREGSIINDSSVRSLTCLITFLFAGNLTEPSSGHKHGLDMDWEAQTAHFWPVGCFCLCYPVRCLDNDGRIITMCKSAHCHSGKERNPTPHCI